MKRLAAPMGLVLAALSCPALAQEMDHADHEMHDPADATDQSGEEMPAMDHAMHGMHMPESTQDEALGNAPPPPVPVDHAADRYFPAERMEQARAGLIAGGRFTTYSVMIDEAEYRAVDGQDGYAWEAEAFYGGDIDRLAVATEGEGAFGEAPESAELRAVWRHALNPWFNLELGARHDFRPDPERSYAVVGIEGLAPYWFEVAGRLFVSDKGDVHLRAEAEYDERITQRLILQPKFELNAAFQDVPELGIGSGVENIELGARLRYELVHEFAPYVGIHWERKLGRTANYARAEGEDVSGIAAVIGIRAWF